MSVSATKTFILLMLSPDYRLTLLTPPPPAEVRLIPLGAPIIIGVLSTVLYGAAYQYPNKFHWFVVLFSYCGSYFAFSEDEWQIESE